MSRFRMRSLIAVIIMSMLVATAVPASAIIDGDVDEENDFPFVALVFDPASGFLCSAGAIDAYHLVTAAHCFQPPLPPQLGGPPNVPVPGILVFYDVDVLAAPGPTSVGTWYPDDWCPGCSPGLPGFDSKDRAVIKLDFPVHLDEYVALPAVGASDGLRNQTPVMLAGYGVNDFIPGGGPLPGNAAFDGKRRFTPASLITSKHKHADEYLKVSGNPSQGKGGGCFGDSGSPLLYDDGGTWVMLANTSYGTNPVCAGLGYYDRTDTAEALAFINSIVGLGS